MMLGWIHCAPSFTKTHPFHLRSGLWPQRSHAAGNPEETSLNFKLWRTTTKVMEAEQLAPEFLYLRRGDESQALPSLWLFFFPFWGTWGESNPGKSDPTVTKLPSGTWPSKNCKKNTLITSLRWFFCAPRQAPPPTPPILTSFAKTTLPSLSAGFRNKQFHEKKDVSIFPVVCFGKPKRLNTS